MKSEGQGQGQGQGEGEGEGQECYGLEGGTWNRLQNRDEALRGQIITRYVYDLKGPVVEVRVRV